MPTITFQILDGADKGKIFRDLATPVTIGREEGNPVRLNDERVSRFHAKVQADKGDLILTDLQSTNGTLVNGHKIHIRRLRHGDSVLVGQTMLLFGSNEEIAAQMATMANGATQTVKTFADHSSDHHGGMTINAGSVRLSPSAHDLDLEINVEATDGGDIYLGTQPMPPLPQDLTPSQNARLSEILDIAHSGLAEATRQITAQENAAIALDYAAWQRILAVEMLLARYLEAIAEPPE